MSDTDTAIFGVPLATVMARPGESTIPTFVKRSIRFLNMEALYTDQLFKRPANKDSLMELKKKIDAGHSVDFGQLDDHHVVAGLLRRYLRELPAPLLSFSLLPEFLAAHQQHEESTDASKDQQYNAKLTELMGHVDPPSRALTEILLLFLSRVAEHSGKNNMTPSNLAVIFGPILLRPEVESLDSMVQSTALNSIAHYLIENFEEVFPKQKEKARLCRRKKATDARDMQSMQSDKGEASTSHGDEEAEKLAKVKQTVDDAICLVQKKLGTLSVQLRSTESLDTAIDIARRVRTAKKVLFAPMEGVSVDDGASRASAASASGTGERIYARMSAPADVEGFVPFEASYESLQGKRPTMEDQHIIVEDARAVVPSLPADKQFSFFGVYDGHGGAETSRLVCDYLHKDIISQPSFADGEIFEAFQVGFQVTDGKIISEGQQRGFKDGSTAVVAVIYEGTLYVANAGDSEAVLYRLDDDGALEHELMSVKHIAKDPSEKQRIEDAGGAVFSGRVFGTLAVSRSLGDRDYKIPTSENNFVSSEPYFTAEPLGPQEKFLLLACDGVWDQMSYEDAGKYLQSQFAEGKNAYEASKALANEALNRGSMDNITAVVVRFFIEEDE